MSRGFVHAFVVALREGNRAFKGGDFETAFAALAPDVEWHTRAFDAPVLHGRDSVIQFYRELRESGEWVVEVRDCVDAGSGRVIVHQTGHWCGRTSKIEHVRDSFQLWEVNADGLVARVLEWDSRKQALDALESQ
jgi:ketosteroid isomerase-like protein